MSQKIDIRERRYNGTDYDTLHPETNINMVLDSSNNSVGDVSGALYGDGNGNIVGAAISNPNLLDNAWFTVNQRGAGLSLSPTPDNQYIVDRWKLGYVNTAGTYQVTTSGLSITPNSQNYFTVLTQFIETDRAQNLDGRELTFSIKLSNGTIKTGSITRIKETDQIFISDSQFIVYFTDTESIMIRVLSSCTIRAVKLELGSVSTLANDVAPDYGMELAKCQPYFLRIYGAANADLPIASGFVYSGNRIRFMLPTPVTMLDRYITFTSTLKMVSNGTLVNVSAISSTALFPNGIVLQVSDSTFSENQQAVLLMNGGYIDISAEPI